MYISSNTQFYPFWTLTNDSLIAFACALWVIICTYCSKSSTNSFVVTVCWVVSHEPIAEWFIFERASDAMFCLDGT